MQVTTNSISSIDTKLMDDLFLSFYLEVINYWIGNGISTKNFLEAFKHVESLDFGYNVRMLEPGIPKVFLAQKGTYVRLPQGTNGNISMSLVDLAQLNLVAPYVSQNVDSIYIPRDGLYLIVYPDSDSLGANIVVESQMWFAPV